MTSRLKKLIQEMRISKDDLKHTPISRIFFNSIGYLRGLSTLTKFEKDLQNANQVNLATLRKIIEANATCEFGQTHHFASLNLMENDQAYKANVPLHTYKDFEPAIERMKQGENNILCTAPIEFFSISSGTSGPEKAIPATKQLRKMLAKAYVDLANAIADTSISGATTPFRGMYLGSAATTFYHTKAGIPVGSASGETLTRVSKIVPFLWSSPWPVFQIAHSPTQWYLHAIFALREPTIKYLRATFASHLSGWLAFIIKNKTDLITDIEQGTLKAELKLTTEIRTDLQAMLNPDPKRADILRQALTQDEGFVSRVWPKVSYASTVITGSFAVYVPNLRRYLPDLPIYTTVYGSSESPIALNMTVEQPKHYVLLIGLAYFEFIPLTSVEEKQPKTCNINNLIVGEYYELVITNWAGLYRYRMGDIVRVEGYYHQTPIISFSHRRGILLDLGWEKVSESHIFTALHQVFKTEIGDVSILIDYTTHACTDTSPPYYEFYLELDAHNLDISLLEKQIDRALGEVNVVYAHLRSNNLRIGPPIVKLLSADSFEALTRAREAEAPHVGRNQLKTPRVLKDDKWLSFLEERVISRS